MSEPRGVPPDATDEYRRWVDFWESDGHSHSYHTVAEIMAYDWTQKTQLQGYVDQKELARWAIFGKPQNWSGDVWGDRVVKLDGQQVVDGLRAAGVDVWDVFHGRYAVAGTHFLVTWAEFYYEAGRAFLVEFLPRLWRLGSPDDVRVVFFFDN